MIIFQFRKAVIKLNGFYFQPTTLLLNLRTNIFVVLAIVFVVSSPHMIDLYWLVILMLIILKKLCPLFFRSIICIDLFIRNWTWRFQNTTVSSAGLWEFYKIAATFFKASPSKGLPKEMLHRDYKYFESDKFEFELKNRI